ncbi:hypothetical protein WG901_07785 [Novosphingobium sp. PS1R-30]|uniref:Uncharacterized protein n=1 Tax=Novosphingobium anseongense TaxID=3133436 RepID=A0ABU8RTV4_9SPHN
MTAHKHPQEPRQLGGQERVALGEISSVRMAQHDFAIGNAVDFLLTGV